LSPTDYSERLTGLLATLSADERNVLVLRIRRGMSTEQAAQAMGVTATAVRLAQHRALNRLRVHIGTW